MVIKPRGQIRIREFDPLRITNQTYIIEFLFARWRRDGFNDFVDRLGNMEELKREKGKKEAIAESKSLIRGHRVDNNLPIKTGISGSLADRVTKMSIYGKERKKIGNGFGNWQNKESAELFRQAKKGAEARKTKQYKDKRKQIREQVKKLKERGNNNNTPWREISDFEDGEFYGFAMILNKMGEIQEELRGG